MVTRTKSIDRGVLFLALLLLLVGCASRRFMDQGRIPDTDREPCLAEVHEARQRLYQGKSAFVGGGAGAAGIGYGALTVISAGANIYSVEWKHRADLDKIYDDCMAQRHPAAPETSTGTAPVAPKE